VTDNSAGQDAYDELKYHHEQAIPTIIKFVLKRMHEQRSTLFEPFKEYLRDRSVGDDRDKFVIGLVWDNTKWNEKLLQNLHAHIVAIAKGTAPPRTSVVVAKVSELAKLIEYLFAEVKTR
jgi:hypothetical protein